MNISKKDLRLYAVTDRAWLGGRTLIDCVGEAIDGGATFIQIREKTLGFDEFLHEAKEISALCRKRNVKCVINDNAEIAVRCGADGVHVGQSDISVSKARKMLGDGAVIGATVKTLDQAIRARDEGADYLGVGAVFNTGTKLDTAVISHDLLREICEKSALPVVAIGGINAENLNQLKGIGISGIAVVSAIFASADVRAAAAELNEKLNEIII